jgi:hypothetical protein
MGTERPEGRERDGGTAGRWSSQNTTFIKFAVLYGRGSWRPKTITIVTSKITDHRNRYNNNNEKV